MIEKFIVLSYMLLKEILKIVFFLLCTIGDHSDPERINSEVERKSATIILTIDADNSELAGNTLLIRCQNNGKRS